MADEIILTENNSIKDSLTMLRYIKHLRPDEYHGAMYRNLLTTLLIFTKKLRSDESTEAAKALFEWMEIYNRLQFRISPNNSSLLRQFVRSVPAVLTFIVGCLNEKPLNMPYFHSKLLTLVYSFLDNLDITLFDNEIKLPKGVISCIWYSIQNGGNFNTQFLAFRVLTMLLKLINKKCAEEELAKINSLQLDPLNNYFREAMQYTKPHPSAFVSAARNLINHMNMQNSLVYSVACNSLLIEDKVEFFKPSCSKHFWVDLNSCPLTLTFIGRCRSKENGEFVDISVIASIEKIDLTNTKLTIFLIPPIIYSENLEYLKDVCNATYAILTMSNEEVLRLKKREQLLEKFNVQNSEPVCYLNETIHEYNEIMNSFCVDLEDSIEDRIHNISLQEVEKCRLDNKTKNNEEIMFSTPLPSNRSVDVIASLNEFSQLSPIGLDTSTLKTNIRKRRLSRSYPPLTKRISPKKPTLATKNLKNIRHSSKPLSNNKTTSELSPRTKLQTPFDSNSATKRETLQPSLRNANNPLLKNLTHEDFRKFTENQWNEFINEITENNCPKLHHFLYDYDNLFSVEQKKNLMKLMLQIPADDLESSSESLHIPQGKCREHIFCENHPNCRLKTISQRKQINQCEKPQIIEIDDNIPSTSDVKPSASKKKRVTRRKVNNDKNNLENKRNSKGKKDKMNNNNEAKSNIKNLDNKLINSDSKQKINYKKKPKQRRNVTKKKIIEETLKSDKFLHKFFNTNEENMSVDEVDPGIENSIDYFIHSNSFTEPQSTVQQQFAVSTNINNSKEINTPDELRKTSKSYIFGFSVTSDKVEEAASSKNLRNKIKNNKITEDQCNEIISHNQEPSYKVTSNSNQNFENVAALETIYEPLYIDTNFNKIKQFQQPQNLNKRNTKPSPNTIKDKELPFHLFLKENERIIDQSLVMAYMEQDSAIRMPLTTNNKRKPQLVNQDMFISPNPITSKQFVEKPISVPVHENTSLLMCSTATVNNSTNYQSKELLIENARQESINLMRAYKHDINLEAEDLHDQLRSNFSNDTKKEICSVINDVLSKSRQKDEIEKELLEAIYNVHRLYEKYEDVSDDFRRYTENI